MSGRCEGLLAKQSAACVPHWGSLQGMALAEVLLVTCCLVLVSVPVLGFFRELSLLRLNGLARAQQVAACTHIRSLVNKGVDPSRLLASDPLVASFGKLPELQQTPLAQTQSLQVPLVVQHGARDPSLAAFSTEACGLLYGVSSPASTAVPPTGPVLETTMAGPLVSPVPGLTLRLEMVHPAGASLVVTARSGGRVVVSLRQPALRLSGRGEVRAPLRPLDLALGVDGEAWVEMDGASNPDAFSQDLGAGRLAWVIPEKGNWVRHNPSQPVRIYYSLSVPAPMLRVGGIDYTSGATASVDYRMVVAARKDPSFVELVWSEAWRSLVAQGFPHTEIGAFQGVAVDTGDMAKALLGLDAVSSWREPAVLRAGLRRTGACIPSLGLWVLHRAPLQLRAPVMDHNEGAPVNPGLIGFHVPDPDGFSVEARMSARGGTLLLTGSRIELEVAP